MALQWLHDLLVRLLHLERRFDPFFRPALDAVLREPLAGLAQSSHQPEAADGGPADGSGND